MIKDSPGDYIVVNLTFGTKSAYVFKHRLKYLISLYTNFKIIWIHKVYDFVTIVYYKIIKYVSVVCICLISMIDLIIM